MHSFYVTTTKGEVEEHINVIRSCIEDGTLQIAHKNGEVFIYSAHAWATVSYKEGEEE